MNDIKSDRTISTSLLLIAGDFNATIKKRKDESCMGSFSRGKINTSGQMLINFCGVHNLFVTNSSFKHPAAHITIWEIMYNTMDANNKTQTVKVFNQIEYIIFRAAQESILQNARL